MTDRERPAPERRLIPTVVSFGALLLLTFGVYGRILEMPFTADNVRMLSWADRTPASGLLRADPYSYPEWRPLSYVTVWLQYRWSQLDNLHLYYVVNLLLWAGCAWLVYEIVTRLTRSFVPALLAAAVVLTDPRAVEPMISFPQTTFMACLFGLAGFLVIVGARSTRLTRPGWIGLSLLLLAAGLCKEYGLAFMGAAAVYSVFERRRDLASAAVAAGLMYALLRLGFAGGATAEYCEDTGYFFTVRHECFDGVHSVLLPQAVYNVAATAIGSLLPGLFNLWGQIIIEPRMVATSLVWLAAAALGWWKGPTPTRMTVLIVAFNAALSFMLYRERDHPVALCALGIAVGVGLAVASAAAQTSARPPVIRGTVAAVLFVLLANHAIGTRADVVDEVADSYQQGQDPCEALAGGRPLDPAFVKRVKVAHGMSNPDCVPTH